MQDMAMAGMAAMGLVAGMGGMAGTQDQVATGTEEMEAKVVIMVGMVGMAGMEQEVETAVEEAMRDGVVELEGKEVRAALMGGKMVGME